MTAIADHCATIRAWLNFEYSDALITSWTRMAEESLSEVLRCKHMIAIDTAQIVQQRVQLPLDWLELDFVRVVDGYPLSFRSREDFYTREDTSKDYTITGNYLIVGGDVSGDGREVEMSYYETIPPLGNDPNWLMTYYNRLLITSTLVAGSAFGFDNENLAKWQEASTNFVNSINEQHRVSKSSGSTPIKKVAKGFG
jgi:hypothetical protein